MDAYVSLYARLARRSRSCACSSKVFGSIPSPCDVWRCHTYARNEKYPTYCLWRYCDLAHKISSFVSPIRTNTHTCTQTPTNTRAHTVHTRTHKHTRARAHTQAQNTQAHARTCTYTHKYTICVNSSRFLYPRCLPCSHAWSSKQYHIFLFSNVIFIGHNVRMYGYSVLYPAEH